LARLFHVRPWEIDRLSVDQFDAMCAAIDDHLRPKEGEM